MTDEFGFMIWVLSLLGFIVLGDFVVRRPSTISDKFSSETTGSIETKLHIEPPRLAGMKYFSHCTVHMTNKPPRSYVVKTFNFFFRTNWVCSLGYRSTIKTGFV